MFSYNYGDLITRLNNAKRSRVIFTIIKNSKKNLEVLDLFYRMGLIRSFNFIENEENIRVYMKFVKGRSVFKKIKMISLPSKRIYLNLVNLSKIIERNRLSIFIISTKYGLRTDDDCFFYKISGEVLFKIEL